MAQLLATLALSLKELRLLPGFTSAEGGVNYVSLETRLCRLGDDFLRLRTPILSAAMQAVTGVDMAIALAQLGGMGILPVSQSIEEQCAKIDAVKRFRAGFQAQMTTLSPHQSIADVVAIMQETGYSTFPVTDTGVFHGQLLGVITDKDFDSRFDRSCRVAERMKTDVQAGVDIDSLREANQLMIQYGRGFLPIVSAEGTLLSVVFKKDLDKHIKHPDATTDDQKRLRIGAAVSTHPEDRERAQALLDHNVDMLVIDASDGHTAFQQDMLAWLKSCTDVPVVGGNVITATGFRFLADAGADAVKIGMGIGSGCTTQGAKATGRGQATALLEIAAARSQLAASTGTYIPLIADGGLRGPGEMVVALALGADALMMGNLLARFTESNGKVFRNAEGETVKEYWMEGSIKAQNHRRYAQIEDVFFAEGIVGHVPHAGSVYDKLPTMLHMIRSACVTAGCRTLDELHEHAVLERQSPVSLQDGEIHGMIPTQGLQRS
ncbi:Inosine-5'-monophosphate dehydrogenase [Candidatus Entotheonellaceae bacterium PAL068K]